MANVAEGLLLVCGGFLLAVLWMDLMFDSQVRGAPDDRLPEPVLADRRVDCARRGSHRARRS